jgi:ankyrin repeat protein
MLFRSALFGLVLSALAFCGFLPVAAMAGGANEALRLVAVKDGREFDRFHAENRMIFADSPEGRLPLEGRVEWRIEGELQAASDRIDFQPSYRLLRRSMAYLPEEPGRRFVAIIESPGKPGAQEKTPERTDPEAIAVAVWLVNARPVRVMALGLPGLAEPWAENPATFWMPLFDDETAGAPVLLLWSKGQFLPWPAAFRDPATQRALEAMHLGSAEDWAEALRMMGSSRAAAHNGDTLLHLSARGGFDLALADLLQRGRGAEATAVAGASPLMRVAQMGRAATATRLFQIGAASDASNRDDPERLADAFAQTGSTELALRLLDTNQAWKKWSGVLKGVAEAAARSGDVATLRRVAAEAGRHYITQVSTAALHHRIRMGDFATVELLIAHKHNIRARDLGTTALHVAARGHDAAIVQALVRAGAEVNLLDATGNTPLLLASRFGAPDIARVLLAAKANVRTKSRDGRSALHWAVLSGDESLVRMLSAAKASQTERDREGLTPLGLALSRRNPRIVAALLEARAQIGRFESRQEAVVEGVIALDRIDLLARLSAVGWSPESVFSGGWSPRSVALRYGASRVEAALAAGGGSVSAPEVVGEAALVDRPARLIAWDPFPWSAGFEPPRQFLIEAVVDWEGRVRFPRLVTPEESEGSAEVLAAVEQWRFQPAEKGGQAVNTMVRLPVTAASAPAGALGPEEVDRVAELTRDPNPSSQPTQTIYGGPPLWIDQTPQMLSVGAVAVFKWLPGLGYNVSVVVEPDGTVGAAFVPGIPNGRTGELERVLEDFWFLPAVREGRAVRSRLTLRLLQMDATERSRRLAETAPFSVPVARGPRFIGGPPPP